MRGLWIFVVLSIPGWAQTATPLESIRPEQAGYSVERLNQLKQFLIEKHSSSMVILQDGKLVFEYGDINKPHLVHSIRKALLSSLLGIEWGNGKFNLDQTLATIEYKKLVEGLTPKEQQATLADVFKSRSGVYLPAAAESTLMKQSKPKRGSHTPGSHYYYNNWDFNFAGQYFEAISGQSIFTAFHQNIARPIGMQHFKGRYIEVNSADKHSWRSDEVDGFYGYERETSEVPAYHFRLSTYDLALYGQLLLNRGRWDGQQIIPEQWLDLSLQPYSIYNEKYGLSYGMLWYVLVPDKGQEYASFYHTGTGVHMIGVYPKLGMVMIHRVNTEADYHFSPNDLLTVIRLTHAARIKTDD